MTRRSAPKKGFRGLAKAFAADEALQAVVPTSRRAFQFLSIAGGKWSIQDTTPRALPPPKVTRGQFNDGRSLPAGHYVPPRGQFNEPGLPALPPPAAAPAPDARLDAKHAKFDPEQARMSPSLNKEVNASAADYGSPWRNRQERANVGYSAAKSMFRG